jgi:hypothetical protein
MSKYRLEHVNITKYKNTIQSVDLDCELLELKCIINFAVKYIESDFE